MRTVPLDLTVPDLTERVGEATDGLEVGLLVYNAGAANRTVEFLDESLAELVRASMRRALTFRLTRGAAQLGVVLVDPTIEDTVRRAVTRTPAGAFLTLAPAAARDVVAALKRAQTEAGTGPIVILTQPDIRRFVRKLVETDLPDAQVVSFAELLPEVALRPLARANLAGIG